MPNPNTYVLSDDAVAMYAQEQWGDTHEGRIAAAAQSLQALSLKRGQGCLWYPSYHIAPPAGWLSVPSGLCFFNGLYHAFYQHNPYSTDWGNMHWGHCTSPDLIHWQHEVPALAPGSAAEGDRDGCFSGSAVTHEGKLYLFYTGHMWLDGTQDEEELRRADTTSISDSVPATSNSYMTSENKTTTTIPNRSSNSCPDGSNTTTERTAARIHTKAKEGIFQQQCLAVSEDGIHFVKKGVVLRPPPGYIHIRDPRVWRQDGRWYMALGARDSGKDLGQLLLFSSHDLEHWDETHFMVLAATEDKNVFMWECPDFFPLGSEYMLLCCPQGMQRHGFQYNNCFQSGYLFGRFDSRKKFVITQKFCELDRGHDFYSPQSFVCPDGRRLLIGWLGAWETAFPSAAAEGWTSLLTLPREIHRDATTGKVRLTPPRELLQLRGEHIQLTPQDIPDQGEVPLVQGCAAFEFVLTFNTARSTAEKYGLWIGRGAEIYIDAQSQRLVLARHYPQYLMSGYRSCPLPASAELELRIFVDHSTVEVFVQNGEACFASRIFPDPDDPLLLFALGGSACLRSGDVWRLERTLTGFLGQPAEEAVAAAATAAGIPLVAPAAPEGEGQQQLQQQQQEEGTAAHVHMSELGIGSEVGSNALHSEGSSHEGV